MKKIRRNVEPNYDAKHDPFDFQKRAYDFCKDLEYAAIFHEQGLGKTKIGIDLILNWLETTDIDTVIIVTKKTLVNNWKEEISFHTYLDPSILGANKKDNFFVLNSATRLIITNFETISKEKGRLKLFCECRNAAILIDESAKIKNPYSKLTRDLFELSSFFQKRVVMSGTPSANRPYDMWAQIYFLDKGQHLGEDFESFKQNTDIPRTEENKDQYSKVVSEIFDQIKDFAIRETKATAQLQLPEKIYHNMWCMFTKEQWDIYNRIKDDMYLEVVRNGEKILDDSSSALKRMLRLMQVTSNPLIIDESYTGKSGKEAMLGELLSEIINEREEKVIVWTSYVKNAEYLANKYQESYGALLFHGGLGSKKRAEVIKSFKENPDAKVLIATPQSAKEGLTLTVANNAIFYDRTFSLDDYLQAQDRIHRISQTKQCHIYNIMIKGSIDEWIDSLITAKEKAAALIQSDIGASKYEEIADYSYSKIISEILNSDKDIPYAG